MHANNIEAVKQILTETIFGNQIFEILVCRGNNTHIDFDRRVATHTIELTVGQYTEQSGLCLWRHITDFI